MEASISAEGVLTIKSTTELESYALRKWFEDYGNKKAVFHVSITEEDFTHSKEVEEG
ncbi:MAG: hypothetical protein WC319_08205 [Candidatus Paceibacterota bacterium]|jgi:uncharacterized protein YodC (DUF2158 family)